MEELKRAEEYENPVSTILISTCITCGIYYSVKNAYGAFGGESHGYCKECAEEYIRKMRGKRKEGRTFAAFTEEERKR